MIAFPSPFACVERICWRVYSKVNHPSKPADCVHYPSGHRLSLRFFLLWPVAGEATGSKLRWRVLSSPKERGAPTPAADPGGARRFGRFVIFLALRFRRFTFRFCVLFGSVRFV